MGRWKVNAELPSTAGFAAASSLVRPADVAEQIRCGNDVDAVVQAAQKFFDAGYTDLALVQVGADRQGDLFDAADKLLPALRELQPVQVGAPA